MPVALFQAPLRTPIQVALCQHRAHHHGWRQNQIPIALAASQCSTSRDFVPWRFLDAGRLRARSLSSLPASKNLHKSRPRDCVGLMSGVPQIAAV